jgi:hypothetical protein
MTTDPKARAGSLLQGSAVAGPTFRFTRGVAMRLIGRREFLFTLAGVALVALGTRGATRRPAPILITSACQGAPA